MSYSAREMRSALPPEKRKSDGTVTRYFYRPVSYPVAAVFANAGFSANAVTYVSIGFCAAGFALAMFPHFPLHVAAAACFMVFAVLDCADGNIARARRLRLAATDGETASSDGKATNPAPRYGEWVDALGGYCAYTAVILSLGLSSMLFAGPTLPFTSFTVPGGTSFWMVLASIACSANLIMRLAHQSWKNAVPEADRGGISAEKRLSEEIGITGWLVPLYLAGLASGYVSLILIAYSGVYCAGCVISIGKKIAKLARIESGKETD
jgi:hypothetical protein